MRVEREDDAGAMDEAEAEVDDAAVGEGASTDVEEEAANSVDEDIEVTGVGRVADEPPLPAALPPPPATELLLPLNALDSVPLPALLPRPVLREPLPLVAPPVLDTTADDVRVFGKDDGEVWSDV